MRKNIWIGFFVVGASTLPSGLSLLGLGIWFCFFFAWLFDGVPVLFMFPFMIWLSYGMMIAGTILTVVGIGFIVAGYQRYSAEAEFDAHKGIGA